MPSIHKDFGFTKAELELIHKPEKRSGYEFIGGEDAGLKRCDEYINQRKALITYKDTRNGLMGANYSSKLSPWLAYGSLSIRHVYHLTRKFEREVKKNDSTEHYITHLYVRDYCYFWCAHFGNKIF
jgi:deoxyribodipyrimidine photo-lyase